MKQLLLSALVLADTTFSIYGYVDGYSGLNFPAPADTRRPGFHAYL